MLTNTQKDLRAVLNLSRSRVSYICEGLAPKQRQHGVRYPTAELLMRISSRHAEKYPALLARAGDVGDDLFVDADERFAAWVNLRPEMGRRAQGILAKLRAATMVSGLSAHLTWQEEESLRYKLVHLPPVLRYVVAGDASHLPADMTAYLSAYALVNLGRAMPAEALAA